MTFNENNQNNTDSFIYLQPTPPDSPEGGVGVKLSQSIVDGLEVINNDYSKTKDFPRYLEKLRVFFKINRKSNNVSPEEKIFMAGFIEGEGSVNVSIKKGKNAKFGVTLDPEFSVTQHINGVNHLYTALLILKTGRLSYKSGSNATLVVKIDNRLSLQQKVIPFYETTVAKYSSPVKIERLKKFKRILDLFDQDAHSNLNTFLNDMLPIWDDLRMQKGQTYESFPDLSSAQVYIKDFVQDK